MLVWGKGLLFCGAVRISCGCSIARAYNQPFDCRSNSNSFPLTKSAALLGRKNKFAGDRVTLP
jgi:hypothetical protein